MLALLKQKWKVAVVIGIGIVLVGFGGWYFMRDKSTTTAESAAVTVEKGTVKVSVTANGNVQPMSSRELTAKSSGKITKINFQNGQQVQKGDLLFELDKTTLLAQIASAQLDIRQAELDLNTTLNQRKQQQVYAPISGAITTLPVSVGQDVSKNAVLMTIQDTGKVTYKVSFNGAQIAKINNGQKVDVIISSMFSVLPGKVKEVDRVGQANTDGSQLYTVTVELSNPGSLAPGVEAQADVHTAQGIITSLDIGKLEPTENVTVRAGVAGTVQQLNVEQNSHVNKGQRVALLSSDNLEMSAKTQELKLQQLRIKLAGLQTQLADYNIVAPFTGIVTLQQMQAQGNSTSSGSNSSSSSSDSGGQNYWQVGDDVKAGQALASIVGGSGMIITVPVDEVDIAKVKVGQKANITVDAFPDQTFKGTVSEVAGQGSVQNNVANFNVTLTVDQAEQLKSGMTANVEILVNRKDGVLLLPIEAVYERQGRKFVILAGSSTGSGGTPQSESTKQGGRSQRANMRTVETGLYNESVIEISSGLAEGDKVVLPAVTRSNSTGGNRPPTGIGGFGGGGGRIIRPGNPG